MPAGIAHEIFRFVIFTFIGSIPGVMPLPMSE